MGFFYTEATSSKKSSSPKASKEIPVEHLNKLKCTVCPLEKEKTSAVKVKPVGSKEPLIYLLGESPPSGSEENEPFSDKVGKLLFSLFPKEWYPKHIRVGHITQCATDNLSTTIKSKKILQIKAAIECCRSFSEVDIEKTKPLVVIGLGETALKWALSSSDVTAWHGRLIPIKVGTHVCWFYPMLSPSYIKDNRKETKGGKTFDSKWDLAYRKDMEKILKMIEEEKLGVPEYEPEEDYMKGIVTVTGKEPNDYKKVESFLESLKKEKDLATDIETTAIRPYHSHSQILTMSFGTKDRIIAFAWDHPEAGWTKQQRKDLDTLVSNFIQNSGEKFAHNLGMEQEWFAEEFGPDILNGTTWGDTMFQGYLLDTRKGVLSLEDLCLINFGMHLKGLSNINTAKCIEYPLSKLLPYNALDVKYTHRLAQKQRKTLTKEKIPAEPYVRGVRVVKALVGLQRRGLTVDWDRVDKFKQDLQIGIEQTEAEIRALDDVKMYSRRYGAFNPGSSDHLEKMFVHILKRDEVKKKGGGVSTDESILSQMPAAEVPLAALILKLRGYTKQKSTYIESMYNLKYPDGKLHTKYGNAFTETGRLNSDSPNGQNFPKRKNKEIREIIVPPPGHVIVASDYGQIEARVIGMLSKDEKFCEALWNDYDVHQEWAIRLAKKYPAIVGGKEGVEDPKKIKALRQEVKNKFVFPSFFGSVYYSIAGNLGIPVEIAESLQTEFWKVFSGARAWQMQQLKFYEKNGYITTPTGRRFRAPLDPTEIFNFPIQGTAADLMSEAMCNLSDLGVPMVLQIHDDITSYIPEERLEEYIELIAKTMCTPTFDWINVPLSVEVECSFDNWGTMKEVGKFNSTAYGYPYKR